AISPAALSLANRTERVHILQYQVPFTWVLPHAQVGTRAPQDFLSRTAQPVQVSIIREDIFPVAHAENAEERWARLEGRAEACFALAQPRLARSQLRFGLFALGDVQRHTDHVRHIVEMDEFRRN